MLTMRWFLLSLVLVVGSVQSQEPTPSPTKPNQPPQAKTKSGKQSPATDQRGTAQSPLVVKTLKSDEEAKRERKQLEEKTTTDRWLMIFTGVLAGVAFLQFIAMLRQEKWMRTNVKISENVSNATRESADASVNTSRPILLPRVVEATQLKAPNVETGSEVQYNPKILFIFENYGKGIATITKVKAELFVFGNIPDTRQFTDNVRLTTTRIVVPGEYKAQHGDVFSEMNAIPARLSQPIISTDELALLRRIVWPFKRFFLVGVVEYEDLLGFEYQGGFSLKAFHNLQQGPRGGSAFNYYRYKKKGDQEWRQP